MRYVIALFACLWLLPATAQDMTVQDMTVQNTTAQDTPPPDLWVEFAPEERAVLARAEAFLNRLTTLRAGFVQTAPNGRVAEGRFYLSRPGRLRFEYSDPVEDFIVADGSFLYYWDAELETRSSQPISDSLANFLLRERVRLSGEVTVAGLQQVENRIGISLIQTDDPGNGTLTLVFSADPFALVEWGVVDGQGNLTEVTLIEPEYGITLSRNLFFFEDPTENRDRR